MERHIVITGGTGFIGQKLCRALQQRGTQVSVYSRQDPEQVQSLCGPVRPLDRLSALPGLGRIDGVINLAGEGIADKRWTRARKQTLMDSRVALTQELVRHMNRCKEAPGVLISGSAVGYYGDQGEREVTEDTAPADNDDFAHRMCAEWETAALQAQDITRVCLSRTGLVVGRDGGFLQRMTLPFRMGLGGRIGHGHQYMPWIHRDDMVAGLLFLLDNGNTQGPYNLTAPHPVTNAGFTRTLGSVLHRPTLMPVPALALKAAMGEMSSLLLGGQKALPARLLEAGFEFRYPTLEPALKEVFPQA
ncbi:MAG: TIGR01777 family oxidoreductase [Oleiphilaceae bacterium]|nr:TIGR01777 family oxidoreductase [Oleiphilaceae bacterium]